MNEMSVLAGAESTGVGGRRVLSEREFNSAYDRVILGNHFFEEPAYYQVNRRRYFRTLQHICGIEMPRPARILEIGGGQMALLCGRLFGDSAMLADVSPTYADAVTQYGMDFVQCDLAHDDLPQRDHFDLVVLCEVVEHLPIPPHIVLEKVAKWIKPGGHLFLTTPNLYRLRNSVRLALGMPVFCNFFYPERGSSLGHPLEYSAGHLRWQLERAGYEVRDVLLRQLSNTGSSLATKIARWVIAPLQWRPLWRDSLIAVARRPA